MEGLEDQLVKAETAREEVKRKVEANETPSPPLMVERIKPIFVSLSFSLSRL